MPFQYAAKFICGVAKDEKSPVALGRYSTVVNVHNPGKDEKFAYKLAVAGPGEQGKIYDFQETQIGPDGAIYFDCHFVRKVFDVGDPLFDGFFVIETKRLPLDVIAVYTTTDLEGRGVPAIDVERVFERPIG